MKQAELIAPETIIFKEVDTPEPGVGEVLLEILSIGICGADIHAYHGTHPYIDFPIVQGHEVSARVRELGSGVVGLAVGDLVSIEPQRECGKCIACKQGSYNVCDKLNVIGCQITGAASEYYVCAANKLVKLDPATSPHEGALLEVLAVGVKANRIAGDLTGKNVLVFGAGCIGNLVAQASKGFGAAKVMVSEINPFRLAKAEECGIDYVINPLEEDIDEAIIKKFGIMQRADVIFECAATDITLSTAVKVARKGTDIIVVSVFASQPVVDMALVNKNELNLMGTARYVISDFEIARRFVAEGLVKLKPLITDIVGFENYAAAYRKLDESSDTCMKTIIKVND